MKILNQDKTKELKESELDLSLGYLVDDKIISVHHKATKAIPAKTVEQQIAELKDSGEFVDQINGTYYKVHKYRNGGKDATPINEIPAVAARDAYDDYEDIKVYIPYTETELQNIDDMKRYAELKSELAKIKEDIEQEQFGIIRDDYDQKKARAAVIINELRVIEGKEPRETLPIVL